MSKYEIVCPRCKARFDCEKEIFRWKFELEQTKKVLEQIKEISKTL